MASIGDLVVNISANSNPLTRGLAQGQASIKRFAGGITSLLTPLAAIAAPLAAAFGAGKAMSAAQESITAQRKLAGVLTATGGAAGLTADQINALASDLQQVTNFEDDATVNAAAMLATFKNIKGDTFKQAIMSAQDLSSVMDTDLNSSIVQVGKALNDPTKGITALTRVGVSFTEQQKEQIEKLQESGDMLGAQSIILKELQGEFGGAAKAMADPFTMAKNAIGDIAETIGTEILAFVGPIVQFVNENIGTVQSFIQSAFSSIREFIVGAWNAMAEPVLAFVGVVSAQINVLYEIVSSVFMAIADVVSNTWEAVFGDSLGTFESWKNSIVMGLILVEYTWTNWRLTVEIAAKSALLSIITFANQTVHFFTEVVPSVLEWFANNWREILTDVGNFTMTVFSNLGSNIVNVIKNIPGLISGSVSFGELWTPLTDGFKATLQEMPDIAERQMGPIEEALSEEVQGLNSKFAAGFGEFANKRLSEIQGQKNAFGGFVASGVEQATGITPVPSMVPPGEEEEAVAGEKKKSEQTTAGAAIRGSTEAFSAITKAMFGGQDKAAMNTANNTKSMDKKLGQLVKGVEKLGQTNAEVESFA